MSTSAARGPGSKHLEVAATHADLGLPVPRGTKLRSLKRMLGRVMWVFGRSQATYNHSMLEAVSELANAVETIRTSIPEQVGNDIGSMRSQVGALEIEVRTTAGDLKRTAAQIDELQARVRELAVRVGTAGTPRSDAPTPSH